MNHAFTSQRQQNAFARLVALTIATFADKKLASDYNLMITDVPENYMGGTVGYVRDQLKQAGLASMTINLDEDFSFLDPSMLPTEEVVVVIHGDPSYEKEFILINSAAGRGRMIFLTSESVVSYPENRRMVEAQGRSWVVSHP